MANVKEYAFYIEGTKLCIVERDTQFDNDVNSKDYGPGVHRTQWKSPKSSVADGIQLLYTYSPNYSVTSHGNLGYGFHKFLGWGRNSLGKLLLFTHSYGTDAPQDITNLFTVGEYINITGSSRWGGVHRIASHSSGDTASSGILTLETRCTADDIFPASFTLTGTFAVAAGSDRGYFAGNSATSDRNIESFKDYIVSDQNPYFQGRSEHYMFIELAADATNNGFWKVTFPDTHGQINFSEHVTMDVAGNVSSATEAIVAEVGDNISGYQIAYEEMLVYGSDAFDAIQNVADESDTIDLPSYLSKALVYYVKAKLAEDVGEFEKREYFMREYKKMTEKYESSLKAGARMIATPGPYAVR